MKKLIIPILIIALLGIFGILIFKGQFKREEISPSENKN